MDYETLFFVTPKSFKSVKKVEQKSDWAPLRGPTNTPTNNKYVLHTISQYYQHFLRSTFSFKDSQRYQGIKQLA